MKLVGGVTFVGYDMPEALNLQDVRFSLPARSYVWFLLPLTIM